MLCQRALWTVTEPSRRARRIRHVHLTLSLSCYLYVDGASPPLFRIPIPVVIASPPPADGPTRRGKVGADASVRDALPALRRRSQAITRVTKRPLSRAPVTPLAAEWYSPEVNSTGPKGCTQIPAGGASPPASVATDLVVVTVCLSLRYLLREDFLI